MKKLTAAVALVAMTMAAYTQTAQHLEKVMELPIAGEGGANGACVAWHPLQKKYYAAMAGNVAFPMNVFDIRGNRLSPDDQTTLFDVRGLWYNSNAKALQANGYDDYGWTEYKLNAKGLPEAVNDIANDMHQPTPQSVGTFNAKKRMICFLNDEGAVEMYTCPAGVLGDVLNLHLGITKTGDDGSAHNDDVIANYNYTTLVYTGIPNAEFGVLNVAGKQIELYSEKDGYLTQTLALPPGAPVEDKMNFAFANGIYWLFDREARKWIGYRYVQQLIQALYSRITSKLSKYCSSSGVTTTSVTSALRGPC